MNMGDFNSITSQTEKKRGKSFATASNHSLLDEFNNLELIDDLGFHGHAYTSKRSGPANIQERLDIDFANTSWCISFAHSSILDSAFGSDYSTRSP